MANTCEVPDESSVTAFMTALDGHDKVANAARRSGTYLLDVALHSGAKLVTFMTNIYVVGEADVQEIRSLHADVNCVVTLSAWNMTSAAAVSHGRQQKVGVFNWKEFFGAINYRKYWLYEEMPLGIDSAKATIERKRRRKAWN
jgi:hypothetical protein